jgi:hypothetical protein
VCLAALCYRGYLIRKLKSDVAIAVGIGKIFLDYIVEQRGALLHLVTDALEHESDPPSQASDLEIKVARIIMKFPRTQRELDAVWNWQRRVKGN